jgi:flagellar assembly factor FliW
MEMKIESQRFGTMEVAEDQLIRFADGMIGFPEEKEYVLLPHGQSDSIAWLQSTENPDLAFPVVSAHDVSESYNGALDALINAAGLGSSRDDVAVMAVLCAPQTGPATINLVAPIVVNATTRNAAQVLLDNSRFSTREVFAAQAA